MPRPNKNAADPLERLNVEEVRFWLRIMEEHTLFIRSGLPHDSAALIHETREFQSLFAALRVRADRVQGERRFIELVRDASAAIRDFIVFIRRLLALALSCQLGGYNFPLFLDHLAREGEYALRLLAKLCSGRLVLPAGPVARENTFWVRIMADHAQFSRQLLDPSERNLLHTTEAFALEFDNLFLESRDFVSMLEGHPRPVPAFRRFLQDVRVATVRLRDFQRALHCLIEECRLLGVMPALMADHILREADHFLLLLTAMEKGVDGPCGEPCAEPMADDLPDPPDIPDIPDCPLLPDDDPPPPCPVKPSLAAAPFYATGDDEDLLDANEPEGGREKEGAATVSLPSAPPAPEEEEDDDAYPASASAFTPPEPPKPIKEPKYKWGGNWPRPLGHS